MAIGNRCSMRQRGPRRADIWLGRLTSLVDDPGGCIGGFRASRSPDPGAGIWPAWQGRTTPLVHVSLRAFRTSPRYPPGFGTAESGLSPVLRPCWAGCPTTGAPHRRRRRPAVAIQWRVPGVSSRSLRTAPPCPRSINAHHDRELRQNVAAVSAQRSESMGTRRSRGSYDSRTSRYHPLKARPTA